MIIFIYLLLINDNTVNSVNIIILITANF